MREERSLEPETSKRPAGKRLGIAAGVLVLSGLALWAVAWSIEVEPLLYLSVLCLLVGSCTGYWAVAGWHMGYASIGSGVAAIVVPFAWTFFIGMVDRIWHQSSGEPGLDALGMLGFALLGFLWGAAAVVAGIVAGVNWFRSRRGDPFIGGFGIVLCLASPLAWVMAWQYLASLK